MCDDETRVQRNPAQDLRGQFMMVYITYAGRKIAGERKGAAVSSETDANFDAKVEVEQDVMTF
mgnify:CR=1|jgi:hypothetical protein